MMRTSLTPSKIGLDSVATRYRHPLAARRSSLGRAAVASLRSGDRPIRRKVEGTGPLARLEAVLFLAREPLSSRRLAQLANLPDGTKARGLARKLKASYDERGTAFQVEEVGGGFQLLARRKFAPWLRRLEQVPPEIRLSSPAMETLSVVAYREPVLRAEIEAIRGVQCGEVLRQLMERDLLRISGRAEELGRPFLYGTTKRFLQMFGLRHLEELPRHEELRATEVLDTNVLANGPAAGQDRAAGASDQVNCEETSEVACETKRTDQKESSRESDPRCQEEGPYGDEDCGFKDEDDDYDLEDEEEDDEDEDEEEDEALEEDELEDNWEEVKDDDDEEDADEDEEEEDWDDDEEDK